MGTDGNSCEGQAQSSSQFYSRKCVLPESLEDRTGNAKVGICLDLAPYTWRRAARSSDQCYSMLIHVLYTYFDNAVDTLSGIPLLQRVSAVRVDVDDNTPLLVERDSSGPDDGRSDDRVLDGRETVIVKVFRLGFALVDLDASLDPSAKTDVSVSPLTVKGTVGGGRILHVEAEDRTITSEISKRV
jgi:hypothetical protein